MNRPLAIAAASLLLASAAPALAQEEDHAWEYQDQNGYMYTDDPGEEGEGAYTEYSANAWVDSVPPTDEATVSASGGAEVTFDTFHEGLAPYGEWVSSASYGQVWHPTQVQADWRPYYNGRWEWTDEGWLWVSDEPWGWAPYHYGRWANDAYYGWIWVPGYQWAPAWVSWRYSGAYVGWAPLYPGYSVYVTNYPVVYNHWTFVPCHRFAGSPVRSVAYATSYSPQFFHSTSAAPPAGGRGGPGHGASPAPTPAWGGPARPFIEQRAGHPITPARIAPVSSPGGLGHAAPGTVPIYRPELRPGGMHPSPSAGAPGPRPVQPGSEPGHVRPAPAAPGGGYRPAPSAPSNPYGGGYRPAPSAPPSNPYGGGYRPAPSAPSNPYGGGYRPSPSSPPSGYRPAPSGPPAGYRPPSSAPGPSGGFRPAPSAPSGGFHSAPSAPSGGGFHPAPSAPSGGSHSAPSGGSHSAPAPSHGGRR
jgi:hypothetical protein